MSDNETCPILKFDDTLNGTPDKILEAIASTIRGVGYTCELVKRINKLEKENEDLMKSNHILRSTLQVANNMLLRHKTK